MLNRFSIPACLILAGLVSFFMLLPRPVLSQNPFTSSETVISSKTRPENFTRPKKQNSFLVKITELQQQLNSKMASMIRETKKTGSIKPLLTLIIIAFIYGVIHAAGPGHGKAFALAYLVSGNRSIYTAFLFGNMIAFFHGLSGAGLVLLLHFILKTGVAKSLGSVTNITQIVSYSLIAMLGAVLFIKNGWQIFWQIFRHKKIKPKKIKPDESGGSGVTGRSGTFAAALIVGGVPCPGVVLVMLFALSMNMTGLGLVLAFALSFGMAVTISIVVAAGLAGKKILLGSMQKHANFAGIAQRIIETTASVLLMLLGGIFLAAVI